MKTNDSTVQNKDSNTITRPLSVAEDYRVIALNQSNWPVELFNKTEFGKNEISEDPMEEDALFGVRIRETIKMILGKS